MTESMRLNVVCNTKKLTSRNLTTVKLMFLKFVGQKEMFIIENRQNRQK